MTLRMLSLVAVLLLLVNPSSAHAMKKGHLRAQPLSSPLTVLSHVNLHRLDRACEASFGQFYQTRDVMEAPIEDAENAAFMMVSDDEAPATQEPAVTPAAP
jgi:hypothetical protein